MITQEAIDKKIERVQEEIALAEKCIEELAKRKQELQEFADSLSTMEVELGDRQAKGEIYYYLDDVGYVELNKELFDEIDDDLHGCGNYYLTKEDAIRAEKQIRLFRLLDRFSRQHGWTDELWKNSIIEKYYIYFDYNYKSIETESVHISRYICQVYFVSESVAQQAIEKYRDLIMEVIGI